MRKYYTVFSVLYLTFLFLMLLLAVPTLLSRGDSGNLAALLLISAALVGAWAYLYSVLAVPVRNAEISDSGIALCFGKKTVSFLPEEITGITETPCRYIFALKSRKYSLTKYGFMKIKNKDIAAEISRLSGKKIKQRLIF